MAEPRPAVGAARPRGGLGTRTAFATTLVALLAVVVSGAIFYGQLGRVGESQARTVLGRQADLVAALYQRPAALAALRAGGGEARLDVARAFGAQQVSLLLLDADATVQLSVAPSGTARVPVLGPATLRGLAGSERMEIARTVAGRRVLVAARPLPGSMTVVLVQDLATARALARPEGRRVLVALAVALVLAAAVGLVLARLLARPLRALAGAARELARGRRDVDPALALPAGGPAEIAEVAEALRSLAAALAASEARQREFLLSVSHELRTPLTAVRGFAEALADGVTPPQETPAVGQVILDEALRLDRLVTDLLDLARLDADDFRVEARPVDLSRIVTDAAEVWRRRCAAVGVDLLVETPGVAVVALTDATRVRQILDGLAENALRVAPAGAPIVLAARGEPAAPGRPAAGVLEVRDGGPGLTADDLAVAFERGALHARYRGLRPVSTGLGLALVARLASRLGGAAEAGIAPEGGASFRVRLPLAPLPRSAAVPLGR